MEMKKQKSKYANILIEELRSISIGMDEAVKGFWLKQPSKLSRRLIVENIVEVIGMSDIVSYMKAYDVSVAHTQDLFANLSHMKYELTHFENQT